MKCDKDGSDLVFDNGVIPNCKKRGLTCGIHCPTCGYAFSEQNTLFNVHNFELTGIIRPSDGLDGSLSYACRECGYTFDCTYRADLNEKNVCDTLISMKEFYPEGTPFDNSTKYVSNDIFPMVTYTGAGCAGFAMELSDKAFGNLPARYHFDFTKIRAGDIVRVRNNLHSVIVLKVEGNIITVAEGNYNSSVHWGRKLDVTDPSVGWAYVLTRYPE